MPSEFDTIASYSLLFADRANASVDAQESTNTTDKRYCNFESSSSKEEGNWSVAEWSDDDERKCKEILLENLEKCTISALDDDIHDEGENWDRFYQDNGTRFFKDRHYFAMAFPNEFGHQHEKNSAVLVELGCGVGNACLPLLEDEASRWKTIHALDISSEAVELMRNDSQFIACNEASERDGREIFGHVCDIAKFCPTPCIGVADVTTLIFCISALDPDNMPQAAQNVASSLKRGGTLIVRDYGRYDEAQMRLGTSRNKRIKDNFYRKHDGTKCYYFSLEDMDNLFTNAGLQVIELYFLRRIYGNKASGERRRRIWIQGRFVKP